MSDLSLDKGFARNIINYAKKYGCLRNQLAYILATSEWETAYTQKPVKEAYWLLEDWRKANLSYYPWYGRGFVQLTWEDNYARAQKKLDLGTMLTDSPDNALEPDIATAILVNGSMQGWFTGKSIPDYITLNHSDYVNARRVINGTDKATEIAALAVDFESLLKAEGYGEDDGESEIPTNPEIPDIPEVDLEALAELIKESFEAIDDLRNRVAALEHWRKS